MARTQQLTVLRARYIFPGDDPPLADALVDIEGSRVSQIAPYAAGSSFGSAEFVDLGNVAILPGLVNAHTHLEFSDLSEPLVSTGLSFADWIRRVIAYRRGRTDTQRHSAVRRGLDECTRAGTIALGEIANGQWLADVDSAAETPVPCLASQRPHATVFHELIGMTAPRAAAAWNSARQFLDAPPSGARLGLSPHAPYSLHPSLVAEAVALSAARKLPLAMHLAESPDELELLRTLGGPLRDLQVELGAWDPAAIPRGARSLDYLRLLADAERALVIHGTFLDDEEIAFLAARRERMAVVYCPRTHARFGFAPYPLTKLLAAGATVALGTDSRASNPDLSLFNELRFVAVQDKVDPQVLLRMATLEGAKALGLAELAVPLAPNRTADLTIVGLPPGDGDPWELLFDPRSAVVAVVREGVLSRFVQ